MKTIRTGTIIIGAAMILSACSSSAPGASTSSGPPDDPIAQMEIAFDGMAGKTKIKEAMDRAITAVGQTPSDDLYSRSGSVLVSFRKEYGISEMKILECMPYRANDPRAPEKTFPNIAAVCLTDLSTGVKVP